MKQARENRKLKLEEHKAKKRGEMAEQVEEEQAQSETETQPSPTNSVDEQQATDPAEEPVVVEEPEPVEAAEQPTPTSGLLCGCL